jgi:hypothetical protein
LFSNVWVCMYARVCVGFVMCGRVCVCVCIYMWVCMCVCMYMYVCVCLCVCVCLGFVMCNVCTTTFTGVFPCFFLSCKGNARVKLAKTGDGPDSSKLVVICVVLLLIMLFYVLFVCKCVLYYCYRVATQLQLNI